MNIRKIRAEETITARRRAYFQVIDTTGAAVTDQGGGQPKISINGGAWTTSGIGALTHIGNGLYYADLTTATVANSNKGAIINTLYDTPSNPDQVFGTVFEITDNMDGYQQEEILKFVLAYIAGITAGAGTSTVAHKDPAGTNARITMNVDANGERSSVTLSASNI